MIEATRLDRVRPGSVVRLLGFARCRRSSLRLAELGLTPGTRIEVLGSSPGQPVLLRVRGAQLALDRRTASTVSVELLSGGRASDPGRRGLRDAGAHAGWLKAPGRRGGRRPRRGGRAHRYRDEVDVDGR